MFWKKKAGTSKPKDKELPGPKFVPDIIGGRLVTDFHKDPDRVWKLKAVKRRRGESKSAWDIRVYDDVDAATNGVKVENWPSLDDHPELILYEGWYDTELRDAHLEERKGLN